MKKNNLIRFVQSLVLLPMITSPFSLGGIQNKETSRAVLAEKVNIEALSPSASNQATDSAADMEAAVLQAKAEAIDAYFKDRDMPLAGMGMIMVQEAEKNGLDWRLVAAISVRESTGGKHPCQKVTNSFLGWGSCKINFKSKEDAIATVARNLGGNNPNTALHYGDKATREILRAYNPPSIVPRYAEQVMAIMDTIGPQEITITDNSAA